jgi:hypothetical protein
VPQFEFQQGGGKRPFASSRPNESFHEIFAIEPRVPSGLSGFILQMRGHMDKIKGLLM